MTNIPYDETKEPHCKYCGEKLTANRDHFHGRVAELCKYNCGGLWQQFKIRLRQNLESPFPEVQRFAERAEKAVFIEGQPAKNWDRGVMIVRRHFTKAKHPYKTHS